MASGLESPVRLRSFDNFRPRKTLFGLGATCTSAPQLSEHARFGVEAYLYVFSFEVAVSGSVVSFLVFVLLNLRPSCDALAF